MNTERILVTGGAGFIGARLVRRLRCEGYFVRVLDSLAPQIHGELPDGLEWLIDDGIEFIRGSVTSRADWLTALHDIDQVVHLAAETGTGQSMYQIEKYCTTNLIGTALLIEALGSGSEKRIRRVHLASSRSVYGEGMYRCSGCGVDRINPGLRSPESMKRQCWDPICPQCGIALKAIATGEDDLVRPMSIYAATKAAQEDLVRIGCTSVGIEHVIYRLQNVYGEGQSLKNPYTGILSIFSTRIRRGLVLPIFEDGMESRDFIYVDDVVDAIFRGVKCTTTVNEIFNVGSGIATNVIALAMMLSKALNKEPNVLVTGEFRLGDIRHNFADISRISSRLDFRPQFSLKEGLRQFADWVVSEPLPKDQLDRANDELERRGLMG